MASNVFLILGALVMTIFVGHVWPLREFLSVAEFRAKPARLFWTIILRDFAPAATIVIWLSQLGVIRF